MLKAVVVRTGGPRIPRAQAVRWAHLAVKSLLRDPAISTKARRQLQKAQELSLVFVSSGQMRSLNRRYRGKNRSTDVLSFAAGFAPELEPQSLGELVFSLDVIRAQARERRITVSQELGYMTLHGILHLLGYDHERSKREASIMFGIQDRIFDALRSGW